MKKYGYSWKVLKTNVFRKDTDALLKAHEKDFRLLSVDEWSAVLNAAHKAKDEQFFREIAPNYENIWTSTILLEIRVRLWCVRGLGGYGAGVDGCGGSLDYDGGRLAGVVPEARKKRVKSK
jgi:hypothetical protein